MKPSTPLISRNPDDTVLINSGHRISCRSLQGQVESLAASLPDATYVINLCDDPYNFILAFLAIIVRGQVNLLPPSRQPGAIREVLESTPGSYLLHDGSSPSEVALSFDMRNTKNSACIGDQVPLIPDDQLAAIVYTSGSTGQSKQIRKYWQTLTMGADINQGYVLKGLDGNVGLLVTVPPSHMFGMEYMVMLTMTADITTYANSLLFPLDIKEALERIPDQRILVTTPIHLRAMVRSGLTFPKVRRILCATAPLTPELAREVERVFSAEVLELYGCTEAGCLAWRLPAKNSCWEFFSEFQVEKQESAVVIDAGHLPEKVTLADTLEFLSDSRFHLRGRSDDLVKIAGKRGSLADLTNRLLAIDGVEDAVIFRCKRSNVGDDSRLQALVVAPGRTSRDIRSELSLVVDSVFLPRPIKCIDSLPRDRAGKLPRAELEVLIDNAPAPD